MVKEARDDTLSSQQARVHAMIQSVGGYWRPINGLARLLEELGELGELIGQGESDHRRPSGAALAEELADIWIISTCTANQFNIELSRCPVPAEPSEGGIASLLARAGWIARILNYYDGPKTPRSVAGWPSLGEAIASFHSALEALAHQCGADLRTAVNAKVEETPTRDAGRFPRSFDPSTSETLQSFEAVRSKTLCTLAERAKLWGAPRWRKDLTDGPNVEALVPYLSIFAKAAEREGLDGFVVAPCKEVEADGMSGLATWFRGFLELLCQNDPRPSGANSFAGVDHPGWQFSFHGVRMFVSVFSTVYPVNHPRHSESGPHVLFQPETSFGSHGIGAGHPPSERIKQAIRRRFAEAGLTYPAEVIDQRVEAAIYLLPRWDGDTDAQWWTDRRV
ncbi:YqcI/YcgG family protein [Actinomadura citrea]|uniref:YqcI/YcgG family protein n=1 Tax=Actinomadura citrea TaxID=46158 RepID=UPI003CE4D5ED